MLRVDYFKIYNRGIVASYRNKVISIIKLYSRHLFDSEINSNICHSEQNNCDNFYLMEISRRLIGPRRVGSGKEGTKPTKSLIDAANWNQQKGRKGKRRSQKQDLTN